ncbi:calcium-binding protein [Roseomonas sp. CCTCC AB2023176]|uniref:calcium-binding protein n=1 Tax=Roseomonas sp. CCTCC AB2023176 TaxID=3342640 RepID=UPI0035D762E0
MAIRSRGGDLIIGEAYGDNIIGDPEFFPDPGLPPPLDLGPDDRIYGRDGNDRLAADRPGWGNRVEGGDDVVDGGRGDDEITGGGGRDVLSGGSGDDEIRGGHGADTLYGSAGDDLLVGGPGADVIIGGVARDRAWGRDTLSYAESSRAFGEPALGVSVDLSTGHGRGGDAEGDRVFGIRDLVGTEADDAFVGDGADNRLSGGRGADRLVGGGGGRERPALRGTGQPSVARHRRRRHAHGRGGRGPLPRRLRRLPRLHHRPVAGH